MVQHFGTVITLSEDLGWLAVPMWSIKTNWDSISRGLGILFLSQREPGTYMFYIYTYKQNIRTDKIK